MTSITHVTLELSSPDIDAARDLYSSAFGAVPQIRLAPTDAESCGFRGFTLSAPRDRRIDRVTLTLGVADIQQSKQYYIDQGLTVAKSFGSKYVEFAAADHAVMLALYKRAGLAEDAGVAVDGGGSHRIIIGADAGAFVDPDGFARQPASTGADIMVSHHEGARGRD
jgi:hypothetical protein